MPVSSNSFFHFTSKYDVLIKILSKGFRVAVSHEVIPNQDRKSVIGVPMVCFCDIPISACNIHARFYCGENVFGFAMNSEWGEKILHPVQYYSNKMPKFFQDSLVELTAMYLKSPNIQKPQMSDYLDSTAYITNVYEEGAVSGQKRLSEIVGLIKPAESEYLRLNTESKTIYQHREKYKYYDEREWRFTHYDNVSKIIPTFAVEDVPFYNINSIETYIQEAGVLQEYFNREENHLKFKVEDLGWIIVDNEDTIDRLIGAILDTELTKIGGNIIANQMEKYRLIQRIISYDRIQKDVFID